MYEADEKHGPGKGILGTEARVLLAVGQVGVAPDMCGPLASRLLCSIASG